GGTPFPANFDLIAEQRADRVIVHKQKNVISLGQANLQADAAAAEIKKRRRTPASGHTPADYATSAAAADNETTFYHTRKNSNRFGLIQQILRDRFFARPHDFVKDARGVRRLLRGRSSFLRTAFPTSLRENRRAEEQEQTGNEAK